MASHRELIIEALVTALTTPPASVTKPAGLAVHRFAMRPLDVDRLPAIVVYWMDCKPAKAEQVVSSVSYDRLLEYLLTVRVECRAAGEPADQVLDPLAQYARQVVLTDPSLGGLCYGVREAGIQVDAVAKEKVLGAAAVDFEFHYPEEAVPLGDPVLGGNLIEADYPTTITPAVPPTNTDTLIVRHP